MLDLTMQAWRRFLKLPVQRQTWDILVTVLLDKAYQCHPSVDLERARTEARILWITYQRRN